jgi:hypothetical protein
LSILSLFGCLEVQPSRAYCMETFYIWCSASSLMPVSAQREP